MASSSFILGSPQGGITAAGTTQATATVLSNLFDIYQVNAGSGGVLLPQGPAGRRVFIRNDLTTNLTVYPADAFSTVNGGSAGAGWVVPSQSAVIMASMDGLSWFTYTDFSQGAMFPTDITASTTLTPAQSGSVLKVASAAAAVTITLPAAVRGRSYEILIGAASLANTVTITAGSAIIFGNYVAGGATAAGAVNGVTNVIEGSGIATQKGDRHSFLSDGTSWFYKGQVSLYANVTTS
jgi:hypothetical protein